MKATHSNSKKGTFWFLKNFNIFDGFDDETISYIDKNAKMCTFSKNEPIYLPADPREYIYFLKEGHVKISRYDEDGQELILDIVGPGEIFGERALYHEPDKKNPETAYALDNVLICNVYKPDFEQILKKYPELNFRITQQLGDKIRRFEQRVSDLIFKDVRHRVAGFLVDYAEQFGRIHQKVITVSPALSHQEIGYLTGSARQTVTTLLNELREKGLIEFNRKEIKILDYKALKEYAG